MTNDYYENMYPTSQHFEELRSITEIYENETTCLNYHKSLSTLYPIFNINTEKYSSDNNSNEIHFNPEEWSIIDSNSGKYRPPRQNEFLLLLLENPHYSSYISWSNKGEGLFKIHEPKQVATLWSKVKHRQTIGLMDYETFARGLRFYYKSGLMIKTYKKHTFRFKLPLNNIL